MSTLMVKLVNKDGYKTESKYFLRVFVAQNTLGRSKSDDMDYQLAFESESVQVRSQQT